MKKAIKSTLALSALILFLLCVNAAVGPPFGGARGNEWDALYNVPPFHEVVTDDGAGGAAPGAAMNNGPGGNNNGGSAGTKDCASRESLPLFSALVALLFIYAVLRVARHCGWPYLHIRHALVYTKFIESMRKVVTKF